MFDTQLFLPPEFFASRRKRPVRMVQSMTLAVQQLVQKRLVTQTKPNMPQHQSAYWASARTTRTAQPLDNTNTSPGLMAWIYIAVCHMSLNVVRI